ncbi:MAG TPA: hypothetical protein VD866_15340, partial [Urbifossiella sp.]|nr:hypothetical protein [Urbifossiella sp.]
MTWPAVCLAALAAAAFPAATAQVPEDRDGPAYYHATRVGDRLVYTAPGGHELVRVVTAVAKKGEARVVSVGRLRSDGKVTPFSEFEVSTGGLVHLKQYAVRPTPDGKGGQDLREVLEDRTPPPLVLKLPSAPGLKWATPRGGPDLPTRYEARGEETVKVPAGEFRAIPVDEFRGPPGRGERPSRFWYARGVGAVKWETAGEGEVVLKS